MTSLYETNILHQPSEWKKLLKSPLPTELKNLQSDKIIFIGTGSSYWVARIAEFLWREYNTVLSVPPYSIQSFDFVKSKYTISKNDIVVVFSHRGTKTFSIKALEIAKENEATTVLITGIGSPLTADGNTDFRIETLWIFIILFIAIKWCIHYAAAYRFPPVPTCGLHIAMYCIFHLYS